MPASPNPQNYRIGRGILSFKEDGALNFRDLGNAPRCVYAPAVERKEHFSSRQGIRVKDAEWVIQVGATMTMVLEEITPENLAFFALAEVEELDDGSFRLKGMSKTTFTGTLRIVGTNEVGRKINFEGRVSFVPTGDFGFIDEGDNQTEIELEAEVLVDEDGNFGVFTFPPSEPATEPASEPPSGP